MSDRNTVWAESVIVNFRGVTFKKKDKETAGILIIFIPTYPKYFIISICSHYKKLLRCFTFFFLLQSLWNLACILCLQHVSVRTSHVSGARSPHVARGHHTGQLGAEVRGLWGEGQLATYTRSIILAHLTHPVSDKETCQLTHLACQHMESRTVSHSKLTLTNFTETDGFLKC